MTSDKDKKILNLLIIGTGMYVCGRGTNDYGTVLPAVIQCYKKGMINQLIVADKNRGSFNIFDDKLSSLKSLLGTDMPYKFYPHKKQADPLAYRDAIRNLPDPGAVLIATPDHLHFEMALFAIENGKSVLVVKPLAPTVSEVYQLIAAAQKHNVYGAVEFHKRWDWANLKLCDYLKNGIIGEPLYFLIEYSQRKIMPTKIFSSWINHVNVFQYLGIHYADIVYFATRDHPVRVTAAGQCNWLKKQGIHAYDAIQVLVEWSRGFTSTFLINWIDPEKNAAMSQQKIKVIGAKGRFESDQTQRGVEVVSDRDGIEVINPYFCQSYYNPDEGCYEYRGYGIESIVQFIKDVQTIAQGDFQPQDFEGKRPTFQDALVSTAIVEGVGLSLQNNGKWVSFGDNLQPYVEGF